MKDVGGSLSPFLQVSDPVRVKAVKRRRLGALGQQRFCGRVGLTCPLCALAHLPQFRVSSIVAGRQHVLLKFTEGTGDFMNEARKW